MVNDRLRGREGIVDTRNVPQKYGTNPQWSWAIWIVKSPTPVVYITWIDYVKITLSTAFTTPSGMNISLNTIIICK